MKKLLLILILASPSVQANCFGCLDFRGNGNSPIVIDQNGNYRGNLNGNPYDPNSVSNPYGRYGSPYSHESINNPYSNMNRFNNFNFAPLLWDLE
jgi:hypothetical protein